MRPNGRIFFPWFLLGILQPHLNCGRGLRPLSFAAIGTRAKGTENMKLRKLGGVGIPLLVCGCASVEMAPYKMTAFAAVPLNDKVAIKIVANNDTVTSIR